MRIHFLRMAHITALSFSAVLLCSFSATAQRGAITLPQNLSDLVDEAAVIVRGHVLSAHVEPHPAFKQLQTVVVMLQVEEALKGNPADRLTFRQFIWDARDSSDAAGYRSGQHLLLFLITPNVYGLSSPAGLEQGRFHILRDAAGNQVAVNGHGNATLFRGLTLRMKGKGVQLESRLASMLEQPPSGPIRFEDLRTLIQGLVQAK